MRGVAAAPVESAAVDVLAVYRRRLGDEPPSLRLLAVARSEAEVRQIVAPLGLDVDNRDVEWEELPLRDASGPVTSLPDIEVVHLVSAGGVDNLGVEHSRAPIGLAAFVDLLSAEAFAKAERQVDPTVVVRTVRLGTAFTAVA